MCPYHIPGLPTPAQDTQLTSTEHVVGDAYPGGGLAHWPLHDGQVHHLQDAGLYLADAGGPCFPKVAPACHPPFIPSLEQALGKERNPMRTVPDSI